MFYKKDKGFTLVELLIVIIIIGILGALGLPQFNKTKEHAIGKEAVANLKLIAAAEKIYRMEAGAYYPIPAGSQSSITTINNYLKLSLTETSWDYYVTSAGSPPSRFTAYAARNGAGGYLDCQYNFAYNDTDGEPNPNASCP